MKIFKNVRLNKYNTFGLDYKADYMIHLKTEKDAILLFKRNIIRNKSHFIIGEGSNILFTGDYKGTILLPEMKGIKVEKKNTDSIIISAGAGVNWDKLVDWTVNKGYGGLENLSLIPGMVGATPVQNIGAYGVEVKDLIVKVKTVCIKDGTIRIFSNNECEFGYRSSIFKRREKGKYLITRVYYKLDINPLLKLDYGSLEEEVRKSGNVTLRNVRQAVINIRKSKLPDTEQIGNAGSFFKNPVVSKSFARSLERDYPGIPFYKNQPGGIKVAAGWLIDQCGWKGKRVEDAGIHEKQALVLVNYGKATGKDIYNLSEEIRKSVKNKFGIDLEREVEVVGSI